MNDPQLSDVSTNAPESACIDAVTPLQPIKAFYYNINFTRQRHHLIKLSSSFNAPIHIHKISLGKSNDVTVN